MQVYRHIFVHNRGRPFSSSVRSTSSHVFVFRQNRLTIFTPVFRFSPRVPSFSRFPSVLLRGCDRLFPPCPYLTFSPPLGRSVSPRFASVPDTSPPLFGNSARNAQLSLPASRRPSSLQQRPVSTALSSAVSSLAPPYAAPSFSSLAVAGDTGVSP